MPLLYEKKQKLKVTGGMKEDVAGRTMQAKSQGSMSHSSENTGRTWARKNVRELLYSTRENSQENPGAPLHKDGII